MLVKTCSERFVTRYRSEIIVTTVSGTLVDTYMHIADTYIYIYIHVSHLWMTVDQGHVCDQYKVDGIATSGVPFEHRNRVLLFRSEACRGDGCKHT